MTQMVSEQLVLDMPRSEAWEKLRDISRAHNYVPGIVNTVIVGEQDEGVGASRYVYRNATSHIQETVVEWSEGTGFLIRLHRGDKPPPLFRQAHFRYQLEDQGARKTLLTTSLEYELPWGALGRWLERKMAAIVQRNIADVALAMKLYYESGEPTTPAMLKACKLAGAS